MSTVTGSPTAAEQELISIQVVQTVQPVDDDNIVAMTGGPVEEKDQDPNTLYAWSTYGRQKNGEVRWLADFSERSHAFGFGNLLADSLSIEVEHYHWMTDEDRFLGL